MHVDIRTPQNLLTGSDSKAHMTRASVPTGGKSESLWRMKRRSKDQLTISAVFEAVRKRSRGGEPTQEVVAGIVTPNETTKVCETCLLPEKRERLFFRTLESH